MPFETKSEKKLCKWAKEENGIVSDLYSLPENRGDCLLVKTPSSNFIASDRLGKSGVGVARLGDVLAVNRRLYRATHGRA